MKIKQIVCENVKNIPNGTYMLPQNITVVSGANGSGKTTLLDLIQYILNGGKAPDRLVKNGTKKAIFKLITEHNGQDAEIVISKTATEDSQLTFKLNGKASSLKKIQEYILSCDGNGKIIKYSDVLDNLKPKELADMMLSYIPEQSSKQTIISYLDAEYTSKNPDTDSMTTFDANDIASASNTLMSMLPDMVTRSDILNAADLCSRKKADLLQQLKNTAYSINQLKSQFQNMNVSNVRDIAVITADLDQVKALKTNSNVIVQAWNKYNDDIKNFQLYNEKLQSLYNQIQQMVAVEPNEDEINNVQSLLAQWTKYLENIKMSYQTVNSSLKMTQNGLDKLNTQECPLSKQLCCTTDKTPIRQELTNNISALNEQLNQINKNINIAQNTIAGLNENLKKLTDAKNLYIQKQTMIENYNQMLQMKPVEPLPPAQNQIDLNNLNQKEMALNQEMQLANANLQLFKLTQSYQTLLKQYHIANYLNKNLDTKGSIMAGIMRHYVAQLNKLIENKVANFSTNWKIGFVFDNGLVPTASINGKEPMPYPSLSTGEKAIVALFITDMLNSLERKAILNQTGQIIGYTGSKTLLIDGLEKLDAKNFACFMNAIKQPAISDYYENIIINLVNHSELVNQVLTGNLITFTN